LRTDRQRAAAADHLHPYFNLPLAVIREINRALARGVKIDIVVGDKTANDFYIPPSEPFKVIGAAVPVRNQPAPLRQAPSRNIDSGQLNLHLWRTATTPITSRACGSISATPC
jgi:phosphatidylserine/phosphatidylglycerophosphate/cardiolipin synthase-like enzyme